MIERTGGTRRFTSSETLVIFLYEGGDRSHCTVGVGREGIQLGISEDLNGLIELKVLAENLVQVVTSKEGNSDVPCLKVDSTKPQKFFLMFSST